MKNVKIALSVLFWAGTSCVLAQPGLKKDSGRMSAEMYIEMFREAAVADMLKTGVPASITLAQGMYESDYGNSRLATEANNHFGIKCHKEWNGPTFHKDDDAPNECFRKYEDVLHSYDDHSYFLRSRERYHFLFNLDVTDYKGWSHGLKKAGYATNPQYASKLIDLIEKYKLYEYDQQGEKRPVAGEKAKEPAKTGSRTTRPAKTKSQPVADKTMLSEPSNTVNGVPFVVARKGDTWTALASEQKVEVWQLLEYNDLEKSDGVDEGMLVFIRPKKNHADTFFHLAEEGETMHAISQKYGVRLKRIYKMNEMEFGTQPKAGQKIYLRRAMLLGKVL